MKNVKHIISIFISAVLGATMGLCTPFLFMVALNTTHGSGVNLDGKLFQIPAWIAIVIMSLLIFFIEKNIVKKCEKIYRIIIPLVFIITFVTAFFFYNYYY